MIAKDLINYMIPPLKASDSVQKAKQWMEELRVYELPVLHQGRFLGFITEEIIYESNGELPKVGDYDLIGQQCLVNFDKHYYDVIKLAYTTNVGMVAVRSQNEDYLGVISVEDVIEAFAQTSSVRSPGGILVLSLQQIDYSLAEISRLIESDDAKILSSYVTADLTDPTMIKLTLKINKEDLSRVVATLERFGYNITAKYTEKQDSMDDKERLDILMKYLKI